MTLGKRKPVSGYRYRDNLNECKLAKLPPSTVNNTSKYSKLQEDKDEKNFDDRPTCDQIPPLPLLYHGFGHFHDTMDAWTQTSEYHVALQDNVDKFIDSMCGLSNEQRKQDNAHEILVRILYPGSQKTFRFSVKELSFTRKTNGHILAPHGGPSFIAEFKTSLGVAEVQLANYFILLAGKVDKDIFLGWRLPALGLLIRGAIVKPTISFHGLLMVDKQVRCVPLADIFVCNNRDVIRNREPLYAATVLLDSINDNTKKYFTLRPAAIPDYQRWFPDIRSLCSVEDVEGPEQQNQIYFQIVQSLADATTKWLLYIANKQDSKGKMDGTTIIVKFSKRYGKEVHLFCTNKGFAPQLLGFEMLPGSWYAIAMEHFLSVSTIIDSPLFHILEDTWIERMKLIVKELHDNGYVHGDLCIPNFIVDGERLLLVDFDWGGKSGKVTFPNTRC
ncbi:hypothetical protein EDB84DRAFT_1269134 [Lactarius hengduanensis]|nr:hypothetical protein EDB84DRAFT_1269134 [Lactarius hengduanensis]